MKSKIILLGLLLGVASMAASAQPSTREKIKRHHVAHSIRTGQLTGPELRRLAAQEHRIHRAQRHARRDGQVTAFERRRIHHMKQQQRRSYVVLKHNARRRYQ